MIHLENLSKKFGRTHAVRDLSLSVPAGEVFGFIGPNGAGKTTTIRMMAGLTSPTTGVVWINGINMAKEPEFAKRCIGLIPDCPYVYDKLTGFEFLRFTADLYGIGANGIHKRAMALLEQFSLSDRADELIESYSHGMKQRLIMSAALLHEPPILIVDEPMVGLDPRGIQMVRNLFHRLAENGTTIFMSTHTLRLAEDICHRIGIIHHGCLAATGSVSELKQAAKTQGDLETAFLELTREQVPS